MATVWSTKYALTTGITKEDGVKIEKGYASSDVGRCSSKGYLLLKVGQDAWLSEEAAKRHAVDMAERKIDSMEKTKAKLERRIAYWSEKSG